MNGSILAHSRVLRKKVSTFITVRDSRLCIDETFTMSFLSDRLITDSRLDKIKSHIIASVPRVESHQSNFYRKDGSQNHTALTKTTSG